MNRKRDKPYPSRHIPAQISKRRRPFESPAGEDEGSGDQALAKPLPPPALLVMGLPADCSVLDLKSRFEIYGSISRIRIDRDGVGYVAYRTRESAEAAIAASLDPSFGITIDSNQLKLMWATDPLAKWREGVSGGGTKDTMSLASPSSSSRLLRAEPPLRRHRRGNQLALPIVSPGSNVENSPKLDAQYKGRQIVAYDDIL